MRCYVKNKVTFISTNRLKENVEEFKINFTQQTELVINLNKYKNGRLKKIC